MGSMVNPEKLARLANENGVALSEQDAFSILQRHAMSTISPPLDLETHVFQPVYSWPSFINALMKGRSGREGGGYSTVPISRGLGNHRPVGRSLNDIELEIRAALAKQAKIGSSNLRALVSKLLNGGVYSDGMRVRDFRSEVVGLGIPLSEEESTALFEHYSVQGRLSFNSFAAAYLPKDWAAQQYAMAELERDERNTTQMTEGRRSTAGGDSRSVNSRSIVGPSRGEAQSAMSLIGSRDELKVGHSLKAHPKRIPVSQSAAAIGEAEATLRRKLYQKTGNKAHNLGARLAYMLFTDGKSFPKVDFENFEYGVNTRLNCCWPTGLVERMFRRYDKDGDGVISKEEFVNYVLPKDQDDKDAGYNILPENSTLLGNSAALPFNILAPRKIRRERLVALRAKGIDMGPVPNPPQARHPERQSNFNPINPEPAWDLQGANFNAILSGWQAPPDPEPKGTRRRKMEMFPPPTPHIFKSFRL